MNGNQETFLDILRAVAAQMVLIGHAYSFTLGTLPFALANLGVVVFFILSGFLICHTALQRIEKTGDYAFGRFCTDRFFRIFVAYVPALVLVVLMDAWTMRVNPEFPYAASATLVNFLGNLVMLEQHPFGFFADQLLGMPELKIRTYGSARPFWTVALEWWLYLFFGWTFLVRDYLRRAPLRWLCVWLLVGVVPLFNMVAGTGEGLSLLWIAAALLAWLYHRFPALAGASRNNVPTPGLVFGATLVLLLGLMAARVVWVAYLKGKSGWEVFDFYDLSFGLLLVCAFALALLWLNTGHGGARQSWSRFLSDYSYSLYLVHYSLLTLLLSFDLRADNPWINFIVLIVAGNVAAIAFWWLTDRHHVSLKHKWLNRTRA